MAFVYWIRLPEHTDMFSEGYVGITSQYPYVRYRSHINSAKNNTQYKTKIQNAILKYGDRLIFQVLVECDRQYAFDLEEKLRPSPSIGWNLRMGGNSYEAHREVAARVVLPKEALKSISDIRTKLWREDRQSCLEPICKKRSKWSRPMDENGNPIRFWLASRFCKNGELWALAQDCRNIYDSFKNCSTKELTDGLNLDPALREWFQPMLRYFDGGWVPKDDYLWNQDFGSHNKVLLIDWKSFTGNKYLWQKSDLFHKAFTEGLGNLQVEREHNLKRSSLEKMFRHFQNGWIPNCDPIWVQTCKEETPLWDTH